jgi:hypothetical protein
MLQRLLQPEIDAALASDYLLSCGRYVERNPQDAWIAYILRREAEALIGAAGLSGRP